MLISGRNLGLVENGFMISAGGMSFITDLSTFGTFTRSTEGAYLTGAATDGSSSFLSWASSNTRRWEDRGDGSGSMLLLEGSSTNYITNSRNLAGTWTVVGGVTTDYANGPDASAVADRCNIAANSAAAYQFYTPATATVTHSSYVRATSGTAFSRRSVVTAGLVVVAGRFVETTVPTTWTRVQFSFSELSTDTCYTMVSDTRNYSGVGGTGTAASDCIWDLHQYERLPFATSPIRTSGGSATRGSDILTATMAGQPNFMINGGMSFDIAPIWSSAQGITHASDKTLFSYAEDDSERIFFVVSGGSIYIRVTSGGVTMVTSNALTFSAHQKLTVTVNGGAGTINVAGATTGNGTVTGTSWTRTVGPTLYIGNRQGATQPSFVRFGRYINAA